jgi:hypothetical protein
MNADNASHNLRRCSAPDDSGLAGRLAKSDKDLGFFAAGSAMTTLS